MADIALATTLAAGVAAPASGGAIFIDGGTSLNVKDPTGAVKTVAMVSDQISLRLNANFTTTVVTATASNLTFAMGANEIWVVDVDLTTQCSSTGGVKYAIGAPAGATLEGWLYSDLAAVTTLSYQRLTAINTLTTTATHTVATTPGPDRMWFTIVNGATPGNCTIQFASGVAAQTTTVFAGSRLNAQKATNV
jgi:hypothetical protein